MITVVKIKGKLLIKEYYNYVFIVTSASQPFQIVGAWLGLEYLVMYWLCL
jgi:hypothetical protein